MIKPACVHTTQLSDYLSGGLPDTVSEELEDHISTCRECSALLPQLMDDTAPPDWIEVARQTATARSIGESAGQVGFMEGVSPLRRYVRRRIAGAGGMGVVWEGWDSLMSRPVALKQVGQGRSSISSVQRLLQEANALSRLSHPHIVAVFDLVTDEIEPMIVMEYVDGMTLSAWQQGEPISPSDAAEVVMVIAGALQHAHREDVVHRDIKPSNVLLRTHTPRELPRDESGQLLVKLSDFGLARIAGDPGLTLTGQTPGTPSYMAPEQIACEGVVTVSTDIYSLGVLLYELLTGNPPVTSANPSIVLLTIEKQDPIPPRLIRPAIPRDLETICLKCLSRDPADRYRSAESLLHDLRAYREGRPILARPISSFRRVLRWTRRNRVLAALMASTLTALLLATISAWFTVSRTQQLLVISRTSEQQARAAADTEKGLRERAERAEETARRTANREVSLRYGIRDLLLKVIAIADNSLRGSGSDQPLLAQTAEVTELNADFLANQVIRNYINTLTDPSEVLSWDDLEVTLRYLSLKHFSADRREMEDLFNRVDPAITHHMKAPKDPFMMTEFLRVRHLYFDGTQDPVLSLQKHFDTWMSVATLYRSQASAETDPALAAGFVAAFLNALRQAQSCTLGVINVAPEFHQDFVHSALKKLTEFDALQSSPAALSPELTLIHLQLRFDLALVWFSARDPQSGKSVAQAALRQADQLFDAALSEADQGKFRVLHSQLTSITTGTLFLEPPAEQQTL